MKVIKFLEIAKAVASFSRDTSTKVGAVAIDENLNILATGYNGFPRGVKDNIDSRYERPEKYLWTSHAEENLVAQAAYSGHSLKGATVLVSALYPCATCARMLIQAGVRRVICPTVDNGRWKEQNETARLMFFESGVEVVEVEDLRNG